MIIKPTSIIINGKETKIEVIEAREKNQIRSKIKDLLKITNLSTEHELELITEVTEELKEKMKEILKNKKIGENINVRNLRN